MAKRFAAVNVTGDYEFHRLARSLARTPADLARAERAFYMASARTVKSLAVAEAEMEGSVARKSAADIRMAGPATIVYGGQGYSMGAEFGSYRYKQFKIWRGNGEDAGYFLWPSVRMFRDKEFVNTWSTEVWRVLRSDFMN